MGCANNSNTHIFRLHYSREWLGKHFHRITDPHAPLLPQGSPSSTSAGRNNAGSAMLHTLAEAVQGRSRGNSRATPPMYVPQDGAVDSLDNVPL